MLYDIEMHYKARNEAIKFYGDYSLMASEVKKQKMKQKIKQRKVRDLKY